MMWTKLGLLLVLLTSIMAAPSPIDLHQDQGLDELLELFAVAPEEMSAEASALLSALIRAHMEESEEKLAKRRESVDKEDDWLWVRPSEPETDYLSSRRRLYPSMLTEEETTAASVDKGEDEQEMYLQLAKRKSLLERHRNLNNNNYDDKKDTDEEERELLRLRDQGRLPLV